MGEKDTNLARKADMRSGTVGQPEAVKEALKKPPEKERYSIPAEEADRVNVKPPEKMQATPHFVWGAIHQRADGLEDSITRAWLFAVAIQVILFLMLAALILASR